MERSSQRRTGEAAAAALVTAEALTRFTKAVFVRAGMSEAHAGIVADVLVWADLRGVSSHGVARIPLYARLIDRGDLNVTPAMTTRTETVASILVEADRAAGPVAMTSAMDAAMRKARDAGVGLAFVRATTHTAALGYYTSRAADGGLAGIALAATTPLMAYHGARAAGVGTSPMSIAVPGGDRGPVVFDMGMGIISMGKLVQARKTSQPIPAGLALDGAGNPATDSHSARIPLPVGGPKGSGLALMIECLTSLVVSNPILAEALEGTAEGRRHRQNGLAVAVDVARFGDPGAFRRQVDRLVATLKALPRDPDVPEILVPGERGRRTLEQRRRDGIPIPRVTFDELRVVAERLRVTMV